MRKNKGGTMKIIRIKDCSECGWRVHAKSMPRICLYEKNRKVAKFPIIPNYPTIPIGVSWRRLKKERRRNDKRN
jgi:hypothetical protein